MRTRVLREFGEHIDAQVIYISAARQKLEKGIYLDRREYVSSLEEPGRSACMQCK